MKKDHHDIDETFRSAFENLEATPKDGLWEEIVQDLSGEQVDEVFRSALENDTAVPSERVWAEVKQELPLNLYLKRNLSRLSKVAAVLVLGMLAVLYVTTYSSGTEENVAEETTTPIMKTETSIVETEPTELVFDLEMEVVPTKKKVAQKKKKSDSNLAVDNTVAEKMQPVELDDEFPFEVNEEKMRAILAPADELPMEEAVARLQHKKPTVSKENGTIIPAELDQVIPVTESDK